MLPTRLSSNKEAGEPIRLPLASGEEISMKTKSFVAFCSEMEVVFTKIWEDTSMPIMLKVFISLLLIPMVCLGLFFWIVNYLFALLKEALGRYARQEEESAILSSFTYEAVARMLAEIVNTNKKYFGAEITNLEQLCPSKSPCWEDRGKVRVYHLILQSNNDDEADYEEMKGYLNCEIERALLTQCCGMKCVLYGLPVIRVVKVERDLLHPRYISIEIVLVSSPESAQYVQNLQTDRECAEETNLADKEF